MNAKDFGKGLWWIEAEFSSLPSPVCMVVAADEEEEAIHKVLATVEEAGVNPITAREIRVGKLEALGGGENGNSES